MMKDHGVSFHANIKALCLLVLFSFTGCATIAKTATGVPSSDKALKGSSLSGKK